MVESTNGNVAINAGEHYQLTFSRKSLNESTRLVGRRSALFQDGAVRIQPTAPAGTIGRTETWVFPKSLADDAIASSRGDVRALEKLLGLGDGYLGSAPVRVDIPKPNGYRIPTGNEFGANTFWRPGGLTWPGGLPEAVIHPVPPSGYIVKPVS